MSRFGDFQDFPGDERGRTGFFSEAVKSLPKRARCGYADLPEILRCGGPWR